MRKFYFRMLAVVLLLAGNGIKAYSTIWKSAWSTNFSSMPNGITATVQEVSEADTLKPTVGLSNGTLLFFQGDGAEPRDVNLAFSKDVFGVETPWKLEFDFGCSAGNDLAYYSDAISTISFMMATGNEEPDTVDAFIMRWYPGEEAVEIYYNKNSSRFTSGFPNDGTKKGEDEAKIDKMSRFTITGDETGVYLSIVDCNGKTYNAKRILKELAYPVSLGGKLGKAHSYMALDNMQFSVARADDESDITNLNLTFNGKTAGNLQYILGKDEVAADTLLRGQFWSTASDGQPGVSVYQTKTDSLLYMANGNLTAELANVDKIQPLDIMNVSFDLALGYSTRSDDRDFVIKALNSNGNTVFEEVFNTRKESRRKSTLGVTSDAVYYPTGGGTAGWGNNTHFDIVLDYANGTITTTTKSFGAPVPLTTSVVKMTDEQKAAPIKSLYFDSGDMGRSSNANMLDNVVVKTIKGDYSNTKTITYKYVDEDSKDITAAALAAGGLTTATPAIGTTYTPQYPQTFNDADYLYDYQYKTGGDAFTVTADATVTIVYAQAAHPTTNVKVQYKLDGNTVKSETVAKDYPVGKPLTYWVNKYVLIDGTLYKTEQQANYYQRDVEAQSSFTEKLTADVKGVTYFMEAEDIEGVKQANSPTRASKGKMAYTAIPQPKEEPKEEPKAEEAEGDTEEAEGEGADKEEEPKEPAPTYEMVKALHISAGKYKLYAWAHNGNNSAHKVSFAIANGEKLEKVLFKIYDGVFEPEFSIYNGNNRSFESEEFLVPQGTDLYFGCEGSSSAGVDYFYLIRTEEIADLVTVGETGYITYAPSKPVDLRVLPENVAYYVDEKGFDDGVLTLTPAPAVIVPEGTGLIITGQPGETIELLWKEVKQEEPEGDKAEGEGDNATEPGATDKPAAADETEDKAEETEGEEGDGEAEEEEQEEELEVATPIEGNLLVGCVKNTTVNAADDTYFLSDQSAMFLRVTESRTIPAGQAYLKLPATIEGDDFIYIYYDGFEKPNFDPEPEPEPEPDPEDPTDPEPDAISTPEAQTAPVVYYNLAGQRVQNPVKGVYIVDGKKVLVK